MKAYKVLRSYNGRLFSSNATKHDIKCKIRKQRTEYPSWTILEYKKNEWVRPQRNAKFKHLFVFKQMPTDLLSGGNIWEVEIDCFMDIDFDNPNLIDAYCIPDKSYVCNSLRLVKFVKLVNKHKIIFDI